MRVFFHHMRFYRYLMRSRGPRQGFHTHGKHEDHRVSIFGVLQGACSRTVLLRLHFKSPMKPSRQWIAPR